MGEESREAAAQQSHEYIKKIGLEANAKGRKGGQSRERRGKESEIFNEL